MSSKPIIVGVTGGIGSGKSTVCKIWEVLGAKVYYADTRAKWLMENDTALMAAVVDLFGEESYLENRLNRTLIAEQAFKDGSLLEELNGIVHPIVKADFKEWIAENKDANLLLKEAALLFENGSYKELDYCILVVSDKQKRINRVLSRDSHRNEEGVKDIINKQMIDEEKIPLADYVIDNNGDESVIKQVLAIHSKLY